MSGRVRAIAGLWFAAFAFIASAAMYSAAVAERDVLTIVLYLAYPTLSAFVAAMLLSRWVVAASSAMRAAAGGVGIALVAFVLFAFLYVATFNAIGSVQNRPAFLGVVLTLGLGITAPIVLPLGAAAGCLLYVTRQHVSRGRSAPIC